ncbi:hypothetical protein MTR67_026523 [Solanum verrucosum]|uniref:Uncharacterized protein n=1 Tax=Solanum verrucosum TaxID=315347 RepID=A0AAF0R308_SOLVR|nr:hypothetical protein MTR67_026523 [Solanum verrucosum]
MAAHSRRRPP